MSAVLEHNGNGKISESLEWQLVRSALRACIEHHGPITESFLTSATQRVLSALSVEEAIKISPKTAAQIITMLNIKYPAYIKSNAKAFQEKYCDKTVHVKDYMTKMKEVGDKNKRIKELEKELEEHRKAINQKSISLGLCVSDAMLDKYNKLLRENMELKEGISDDRVREIVAENTALKQKILTYGAITAAQVDKDAEIRILKDALMNSKKHSRGFCKKFRETERQLRDLNRWQDDGGQ
jgi:hypothetical protein